MLTKNAFLMSAVLLLASCGYHLRGDVDLPDSMKKVYVYNGSPQLQAGFRNVFQYSAGTLVASPEQAGIIVHILNERMKRRAISLTGTGKANEFELHYLLDYDLLDAKGRVLTQNQTVDLYRNYFNEQQEVIGKANEERIIRQEMYRHAVEVIVRKALVAFK